MMAQNALLIVSFLLMSSLHYFATTLGVIATSHFIDEDLSLLVLPPATSNGSRVLLAALLYFPGAGVPADKYIPMMKATQISSENEIALWGILVQSREVLGVSIPPFARINSVMQQSVSLLKKRFGVDLLEHQIFLGGHSLGGVIAQRLMGSKNGNLGGLILHGSYLVSNSTSDAPVMTIAGTRDGLTRLTRIALQYDEYVLRPLGSRPKRENEIRQNMRHLHMVIPGVNHRQFCNGFENFFMKQHDLPAAITNTLATNAIGERNGVFIRHHLIKKYHQSEPWLLSQVDKFTKPYLLPIIEAMRNDTMGITCEEAQRMHLNTLDSSIPNRVNLTHVTFDSLAPFLLSKPVLHPKEKNQAVNIVTSSLASYEFNPLDLSLVASSPRNYRCKMKNIDAVTLFLNLPATPSNFPTCQSLNQAVFQRALARLSADARAAYLAEGARLKFAPDEETTTGISWASSELSIQTATTDNETGGSFAKMAARPLPKKMDGTKGGSSSDARQEQRRGKKEGEGGLREASLSSFGPPACTPSLCPKACSLA